LFHAAMNLLINFEYDAENIDNTFFLLGWKESKLRTREII